LKSVITKWIKKYLGQFPKNDINCDISHSCSFAMVKNLILGKWIFIGPKCFLDAKGSIYIDDGVVISSRVTILTSNHNYRDCVSMPYSGEDVKREVRIKKGVWIGYGAIIMPGVVLNEGSIVAAGSVVTKNVPSGCIVGGNPAIKISERQGDSWLNLLNDNKFYIKNKYTK